MRTLLAAALVSVLSACAPAAGQSDTPQAQTSPAVTSSGPATATASRSGLCSSTPRVEYAAPGISERRLAVGAHVTVTAKVGQPVIVHFVGSCAPGGRLMINGAGPGGDSSFTSVPDGNAADRWSPTEPGTRTLLAAWACMGPMTCPLATLAQIRVVTPRS